MGEAVRQVLPANAVAPSLARRHFRGWLGGLGWPPTDTDDLLLAVSEAVSNAADHAYPPHQLGDVVVEAECVRGANGSRQVVVTVLDEGAWRPPPAWHENRRRGVLLMRACTESVDIWGSPSGTRVRMVSKPVPV
jgi:anti-sigma regulatory factor (Ser/Thr protein kinase)